MVKFEMNQIIYLEEVSIHRYLYHHTDYNLTNEERWSNDLSRGEVIKIDNGYYYVMVDNRYREKIVKFDINSTAINEEYRVWLSKEDYMNMKRKQDEIATMQSKAYLIIKEFSEFELSDFLKEHGK